jgi:flagellar P-ring protein precursor FlgI
MPNLSFKPLRNRTAAWLALLLLLPAEAWAVRVADICRVKGQEENTLHGLGLVVGLKGTGDGGEFAPTIRALGNALQRMGNPLGKAGVTELKSAKNVALVMVSATVPAGGARQGDRLDCVVTSVGAAKSLAGGYLMLTPLQGPVIGSPRVYAFGQGPVHLSDPRQPNTGSITMGCRLEEDFFNPYVKDGVVTLVLDKDQASFVVAQDVADAINQSELAFQFQGTDELLARPLDGTNIAVTVPAKYREETVDFIAQVLNQRIGAVRTEARVDINQAAGSIVISGDVEVSPAVVTHKNIVVETGDNVPTAVFVPVDPEQVATTKLKALVEALNAVQLPAEDIIEIIKGLDRTGKLHGRLMVR